MSVPLLLHLKNRDNNTTYPIMLFWKLNKLTSVKHLKTMPGIKKPSLSTWNHSMQLLPRALGIVNFMCIRTSGASTVAQLMLWLHSTVGTVSPPPALAHRCLQRASPALLPAPPLGSPCPSSTCPVSRPPKVGGSSRAPGSFTWRGLQLCLEKRETSKIKTHVTGKWWKLILNSTTVGIFSYMNNN